MGGNARLGGLQARSRRGRRDGNQHPSVQVLVGRPADGHPVNFPVPTSWARASARVGTRSRRGRAKAANKKGLILRKIPLNQTFVEHLRMNANGKLGGPGSPE